MSSSPPNPLRGPSDDEMTLPAPGGRPLASGEGPAGMPYCEGYEIIGELNRGGQGVVYEATQKATKRKVAIKVLLKGAEADEVSRQRFQREIELLAHLSHPGIVSVFDADVTADGKQFYVMEYVHGRPLDRYVQENRPGLEALLQMFGEVCDAVHYAHTHGIIHRDLKSHNILVDGEGKPHVLDFGLAKPLAPGGHAEISVSSAVMGTLSHMSPEQASGDPQLVDARTDVYTLGVVLYRMLTGRFPYDAAGSIREVLDHIQNTPPQPPSLIRKGIDADLETILLTCLAKDRGRRYQTAAALAADIRAYLGGAPIQAKRDNFGYIVLKRARRVLARHPLATRLFIVVVSAAIARFAGEPLVFEWTRANRLVEGLLTSALRPATAEASLPHVRILGLTDQTAIEELTRRQGVVGVTQANRRSLRRLHGRLMEKLAKAGVGAVAWDISFSEESEFDADFARGAQALRAAGIGVVVSILAWPLEGIRSEDLSKTIAPAVRWGRPAASLTDQTAWRLVLFMQRGQAEPIPSLALATLAAYRHPEAEFVIRVDADRETLLLQYYTPDPVVPNARVWMPDPDDVLMTALWSPDKPTRRMLELRPGDVVGYYILNMPDDAVLSQSTIDIGRAFDATEQELRELVGGKVVVIGDLRGRTDRHRHADGRELAGCHANAVGIEQLLQWTAIRRPRETMRLILIVLGAAVGLVLAEMTYGRRVRGYAMLLTAMILAAAGCMAGIRLADVLCNPLVPLIAMACSFELGLLAREANPPLFRNTGSC